MKLIPDSKRTQRRSKVKVKASPQFCKPEDAKEKCLPTYLSLAFTPALEKYRPQRSAGNLAGAAGEDAGKENTKERNVESRMD